MAPPSYLDIKIVGEDPGRYLDVEIVCLELTMPDFWDAKKYLQFAEQRLRPFLDLVDRAEATGFGQSPPRRVADLGCGPGNATALLADRWPNAHVLGVDSSPAMIEDAAPRAVPGRLEFELGDLRTWQPKDAADGSGGAPDLVLANAVLQWIPGHLEVVSRLAGQLPAGGTFGMQVPGNFGAPSHTLLAEVKKSARWRDLVPQDTERPASFEPEVYLDTLERAGLEPDVWETTYTYLVEGETGVADFVRGSALRPVTARLSPEDTAAFTADYQALVREAYPPREVDGRVTQVLPFRRIFAIGQRR
jgi:trans-aconitate 2-methyltransferase